MIVNNSLSKTFTAVDAACKNYDKYDRNARAFV